MGTSLRLGRIAGIEIASTGAGWSSSRCSCGRSQPESSPRRIRGSAAAPSSRWHSSQPLCFSARCGCTSSGGFLSMSDLGRALEAKPAAGVANEPRAPGAAAGGPQKIVRRATGRVIEPAGSNGRAGGATRGRRADLRTLRHRRARAAIGARRGTRAGDTGRGRGTDHPRDCPQCRPNSGAGSPTDGRATRAGRGCG